jgi:hypothetical protein
MELRVMMVDSALQLIHARQVFVKVREAPVQEVLRVMRRPSPAIVLRMQTVTMGHSAMELRPVILQPVVDRVVTPVLMMGHSVMVMKAVMKKTLPV